MKKRSSGILMFRMKNSVLEFLLAHPGGPFYRNKDTGVWSIPKGEFPETENARDAAIREFKEELGIDVRGAMIELTPIIQKAGKEVLAWAVEGDLNPDKIVSDTFALEWPPRSGKMQEFPEVDRVGWFSVEIAKQKIISGQIPLLEETAEKIRI